MTQFKSFAWRGAVVALAMVVAWSMLLSTAYALVTVATPASATINLSQNATTGTNTATALPTMVLDCVATTDCPNSGVLVITAPSGFKLGGTVTAGVVPTGEVALTNVRGAAAGVVTASDGSTVTVTIAANGVATAAGDDFIVIGLTAVAIDGVETTGNITSGAGSTAVLIPAANVLGVLTVDADGASNYAVFDNGTRSLSTGAGSLINLNHVHGAAAPTSGSWSIISGGGSFPQTGSTTSLFVTEGASPDLGGTAGSIAAGDMSNVPFQTPSATGTVLLSFTPTGGTAQNLTITLTAAALAPASGSVASVGNATSIGTAGSTLVLTASFLGSNGVAAANGGAVNVTTNLGTLSGQTNGSCPNTQACSGTLATVTSVTGRYAVTLTHQGAAGTATVNFTSGGVTASMNIVLAGAASTITVAPQTGQGIDLSRTAASTTTVNYQVRDSAGTLILNTPTITAAAGNGAGCGTAPAATGGLTTTASGTATFTAVANASPAGTVCTFTLTAATGVTTTFSFTLRNAAGATSVITITTPETCALNTTCTIAGTVRDADGNSVADGSTVNLVVSSGAMVTVNPITVRGGAFTSTFLAPGTAQNITVAASSSVTTVPTVSAVFSVGGAVVTPPPAGGPGTFAAAPSFGTGNVGSAVFQGGTIEQLVAAVTAAGGTSVWVQDANGTWRSYNTLATGSAAFVNNGFNTAFAAGFGVQAVFVVR